jgi:hypothetical protein
MQEGMTINEVDQMDFRYFMKVMNVEAEKKEIEEAEKFQHVYIDDLSIF